MDHPSFDNVDLCHMDDLLQRSLIFLNQPIKNKVLEKQIEFKMIVKRALFRAVHATLAKHLVGMRFLLLLLWMSD